MSRDGKNNISTCPNWQNYDNATKPQGAPLNPIATSAPGDLLPSYVLVGKASLPTTEAGKNYILTYVDLFTRFGLAAPMLIKLRQRWWIRGWRVGFYILERRDEYLQINALSSNRHKC